jgi:hypothetical protein
MTAKLENAELRRQLAEANTLCKGARALLEERDNWKARAEFAEGLLRHCDIPGCAVGGR